MAISRSRRRGQQSQTHRRDVERNRRSGSVTDGQRKFLRRLIHTLADIIDEKGPLGHDNDDEVEDVENVSSDDGKGLDGPTKETESAKAKQDLHPKLQHPEFEEISSLDRFYVLYSTHRQLISQIQSSLKALGGGDRPAKALEDMHTCIFKITKAFWITGNAFSFYPGECFDALNQTHDAANKVINSFRELGVFNITFFEKTRMLTRQLKIIAKRLEVEYSIDEDYVPIDVGNTSNYINFLLGELNLDFEAYIHQLTDISEKEIAAIRQSQEFLSQRYLNLTTVATFLSSVTATTLQTTAGDPASTLEVLINTLWFLSLVFSTASAVYSLLVMTWRQSSVRQPDKSLPPWADAWLRNGSMYALIVALSTFSIGLCLFAFEAMVQQGQIASAVVPTAFAGLHAYIILIVSFYFLSEKWKERHKKSWKKLVAGVHSVADKVNIYGSRFKDYFSQKLNLLFSLTTNTTKPPSPTNRGEMSDLELGQITAAISPIFAHLNHEINQKPISEQSSGGSERVENVEIKSVLAFPQGSTSSADMAWEPHNLVDDILSAMVFDLERSLEFSSDGRFLAHGCSNKLILYIFGKTDRIFSLPKEDRVLQVAWSLKSELLIRTYRKLFVWTETQIMGGRLGEPSVIQFDQNTIAARWFQISTSDVSMFFCASYSIVKLFNSFCEELQSFNLLEMLAIDEIIILDVASMGTTHILCLATTPANRQEEWAPPSSFITRLLVINVDNGSIENDFYVNNGHKYLAISDRNQTFLVYGDEWTDIFSVEASSPLKPNKKACVRNARSRTILDLTDNGILIEASDNQVRLLYQEFDGEGFSVLHSFTMQDKKANAPNPTCFAFNHASGPYMLAFGDRSGSIYIWFVQRNNDFRYAETSNVEDRQEGRQEPIISLGRFMIHSPSEDV